MINNCLWNGAPGLINIPSCQWPDGQMKCNGPIVWFFLISARFPRYNVITQLATLPHFWWNDYGWALITLPTISGKARDPNMFTNPKAKGPSWSERIKKWPYLNQWPQGFVMRLILLSIKSAEKVGKYRCYLDLDASPRTFSTCSWKSKWIIT